MVQSRAFAGIPIKQTGSENGRTTLSTSHYTIVIDQAGAEKPCAFAEADISGASRISSCDAHAASCLKIPATRDDCCNNCTATAECKSWIFQPDKGYCYLMKAGGQLKPKSDRNSGGSVLVTTGIAVNVSSPAGTLLWSTADLGKVEQNLVWPSPNTAQAYAIKDYPRFYSPPWGPTPIPDSEKVDPSLVGTNGYDYTNNIDGDTYVFLLGADIAGWHASRGEFVSLVGPTPVLPDYAFGTWFTYWHQASSVARVVLHE
jgi:hypothetical protein